MEITELYSCFIEMPVGERFDTRNTGFESEIEKYWNAKSGSILLPVKAVYTYSKKYPSDTRSNLKQRCA